MLIKRIITALSTAAFAISLFVYAPLWTVPVLLILMSGLVQFEFYQIVSRRYEVAPVAGILAGTLWIGSVFTFPACAIATHAFAVSMCFLAFLVFMIGMHFLFYGKYKNPLCGYAMTLIGFFYIPFMLSFFLRYVQLDSASLFALPSSRSGLYLLLFLIAATKFSDMGGFAIGNLFGKHKMCPSISPKKSWEGFVGSIIGGWMMAFLFRYLAVKFNWNADCPFWNHFTVNGAIVAGVAFATVGTLGDLIESRFKREFEIKDSATFMPAGLGGFLDMFDSIIFVPALFYPIFYWYTFMVKA